MKTWRNGSNRWTAKFAALLFAVQALLIGFSFGANAEPMPRDAFGRVICTSASTGATHEGGQKSDRHAALLDCCTLGCSMFAADGAASPPQVLTSFRRYETRTPAFVLREGAGSLIIQTPRNTRAPPLTI